MDGRGGGCIRLAVPGGTGKRLVPPFTNSSEGQNQEHGGILDRLFNPPWNGPFGVGTGGGLHIGPGQCLRGALPFGTTGFTGASRQELSPRLLRHTVNPQEPVDLPL